MKSPVKDPRYQENELELTPLYHVTCANVILFFELQNVSQT